MRAGRGVREKWRTARRTAPSPCCCISGPLRELGRIRVFLSPIAVLAASVVCCTPFDMFGTSRRRLGVDRVSRITAVVLLLLAR